MTTSHGDTASPAAPQELAPWAGVCKPEDRRALSSPPRSSPAWSGVLRIGAPRSKHGSTRTRRAVAAGFRWFIVLVSKHRTTWQARAVAGHGASFVTLKTVKPPLRATPSGSMKGFSLLTRELRSRLMGFKPSGLVARMLTLNCALPYATAVIQTQPRR
jgi:hypothetical protein